ncbi:MAG: hypothetical protein WC887_02170 [Candidatus Paceibacterota bacterium]
MEPLDGNGGTSVGDLTIKVEKADGDLMFRQADNVGLGDDTFIFQMKGDHRDQIMRRGEYLFAIDGKGKIINRVNWPRNDKEHRTIGEVYGWSVLWATKHGKDHYSNPIWDITKFFVWVTVEAWYMDTKNDIPKDRFGEFRDRSVHITIYGAPDCGFEKLQEQSCPAENLYLDSDVLMRATLINNHDIITIGGRLDELCRLFQDEVYFNGMKTVLDGGEYRGASGQFGAAKVLCAEMCGYDRVMLEDSVCWITFQLRPDASMMYVLGMGGTLPQLRNLIKFVVKMWNDKIESRSNFKPDKNVSVM